MARGMKIAFFGSSLVSAYWNGAASYYRGLIRNLHELGHRVTFYEPDAYGRQQHRDIDDPPWAEVVVYPGDDEDAALEMVDAARRADVVVKASGVGVYDALLEAAIAEVASPRRRVAFWDMDAPATLERVKNDPSDPFKALIPKYDLVFTYGGGQPVIDGYLSLEARACIPIYNALDPETHHPVEPDTRFGGDLSFLGNRLPDREGPVEELFLRAAAQVPDRKFLLGGNGWQDHPMPSNVRWLGHIYTREHNAFNCTPKAVLNITSDRMARSGWWPPARVFEAAGAGACVISDAWKGIEMFLEPGREVLVAASGGEVAEHVAGLTLERARAIGEAGRRRLCAEHTYAHRARQVSMILEGKTAVTSGADRTEKEVRS